MKYLDEPMLLHLSDALSNVPYPGYRINARFEAYSIKTVRKETRMFKEMEELYVSGQEDMDDMHFSHEMKEAAHSSCFGRLDEKESRKIHFTLVSTLNTAFPDYDFTSLRPDAFTREPSAPHVLANVSTNLLGPGGGGIAPYVVGQLALSPPNHTGSSPKQAGSTPMANSPSNPPTTLSHPQLYKILNDVLPLDECEVYSWFPEPEYDPHVDPEDGEFSEDDDDPSDEDEEEALPELGRDDESMDHDVEAPASWGQAGMELDDVLCSMPPARRDLSRPRFGANKRVNGGLMWSQNYFFYSKRTKRVLFVTCWCRKRSQSHPTSPEDKSAFPLPISSSFNATSDHLTSHDHRSRPSRPQRVHNRANARPGQRKKIMKSASKGDLSLRIPIRDMEAPRPMRLATSAPSAFPVPSPQAALAKMTAGGFRPRQTPARTAINASTMPKDPPTRDVVIDLTQATPPREGQRVRKDRSESATPGPRSLAGLVDQASGKGAAQVKGKRVKV